MRPESSHLVGGKGESYGTPAGETIDCFDKAEPTHRRASLKIQDAVELVSV
jgi:hypothetical protein